MQNSQNHYQISPNHNFGYFRKAVRWTPFTFVVWFTVAVFMSQLFTAKPARANLTGGDQAIPPAGSELTVRLGVAHWEVKEELGFSFSENDGTGMDLNPSVQYFVMDRLSVGGSMEIFKRGADKSMGLGPALSYYFHTQGPYAFYVGQRLMFRFSSPQGWSHEQRLGGTTYLGFNYFSSPKVAFGGMLAANYSLTGPALVDLYSNARFIVTFYY